MSSIEGKIIRVDTHRAVKVIFSEDDIVIAVQNGVGGDLKLAEISIGIAEVPTANVDWVVAGRSIGCPYCSDGRLCLHRDARR